MKDRKSAARRTRQQNPLAGQRSKGKVRFAVETGQEEGWPRVWFIWRGNALMSAPRGTVTRKHYLGTHEPPWRTRASRRDRARVVADKVRTGNGPRGGPLPWTLRAAIPISCFRGDLVRKGGLIRRTCTASSIPLRGGSALLESAIGSFPGHARRSSRAGRNAFPQSKTSSPPLALRRRDRADGHHDWRHGECEPIPANIYQKVMHAITGTCPPVRSFGPNARENSWDAWHRYAIADVPTGVNRHTRKRGGKTYLRRGRRGRLQHHPPVRLDDWRLAYRSYQNMERGQALAHLADGSAASLLQGAATLSVT